MTMVMIMMLMVMMIMIMIQEAPQNHRVWLPTTEMIDAHGVRVLAWPPVNPDLQPLDFCFWQLIQDRVTASTNRAELIAKIILARETLNREWADHRRIIKDEFPNRLHQLTQASGEHFEE